MKRLILFELIILFLATTFESDSPPGWFQQVLPVNDFINDIFFLDSSTGWVVTAGASSGSDSGYVMKTTDGGNSWIVQYNPVMNFNAVQFVNNNTGYTAGGNGFGRFYKTTNSGINWSLTATFGFITIKDLFFVNNDTGWICSDDPSAGGLFKTTNGGLNWQPQLGASSLIKKLFFLNQDTGWAASSDANGKLYRTINGGQIWNLQYTFSNSITSIFFSTMDTGYTGSFKTVNSGFNWSPMTNSQATKGVYFINGKTGWSCDFFSTMQKTIDGQNWYNQTVPVGGWTPIQFLDTSKGWAGGNILIHTTEGGGPPVGIQQISSEIPSEYKLFQNYPNPFNPKTNIKYQIVNNNSYIKLFVYDIQGKQIAELVNQDQDAGTYEADWNASGYPSGVYFYSLLIEGLTVETRKMVLVK